MITGYTSFTGGLDKSREPNLISPISYYHGVNVYVPFYSDRLATRPGITAVTLEFPGDREASEIYAQGHVQATGTYTDGEDTYHLRVIDGYIFEFCEVRNNVMSGRIRNRFSRNNETRTKAWICAVPGGAIIQDGQSLPIYITPSSARRTIPSNQEIGVGRMMTYVQNRLFYVSEDSNFIYASNFGDPISLSDAYSNNIFGFYPPDASDKITAIGTMKALNRDIYGGELVFSTVDNIYSADVRGALTDWGNQGLGVARLVMSGVGAVSQTSFENFNTNLWFRSTDGIVGFKQSQYQFTREDSLVNSSIEVQQILDRDTPWALDQCSSVNWNNRLITLVSPEINKDGYVYWSGMLAMSPSPAAQPDAEAMDKRYDGLWTGVRPWGMSVEGKKLFIDSHDSDGYNRMYVMIEGVTHDTNAANQRIEIEGAVETRSFDFDQRFMPKNMNGRQIGLHNMPRDVTMKFKAREDGVGEWRIFDHRDFLIRSNCDHEGKGNDVSSYQPQSRKYVRLASEGVRENPVVGDTNGNTCYHMQYRLEFKGYMEIGAFVVEADEQTANSSTTPVEEEKTGLIYTPPSDYNYSINNAQR